jgi:hypothetical protein
VRKRDPRQALARRRRARARVRIVEVPQSGSNPDGSLTSLQTAEVTLPRSELDRIWTPEYLERLARTYWRFLTRVSLGLLRVVYTPTSREIVFLARPLVLLRFSAPEYDISADSGSVTWRIRGGLLVAPAGRGKGYLRISVLRVAERGDEAAVWIASEVASFFPMIRGWGWFARIGQPLYAFSQMRIHVIVTHAFLRSLANLDLAPSVVGTLLPPDGAAGSAQPLADDRA